MIGILFFRGRCSRRVVLGGFGSYGWLFVVRSLSNLIGAYYRCLLILRCNWGLHRFVVRLGLDCCFVVVWWFVWLGVGIGRCIWLCHLQ